jgi:acyl carrier protein
MFGMLIGTFKAVSKSLDDLPAKGIVKAGIAMMVMAKAVDILADAIVEIGKLSLKEIIKGLIGVGGGLIALIAGLKAMNGVKVPMSTAVTILALAKACDILGDALQKFGSMSWDEIKHGLTAMGVALAEFVVTLSLLNKFSGSGSLAGSISMLIAVQSLDELSENLKKFGSMAWGEIGRGLAAMGGALAELGVALGVLGKVAGFSGLLGAATMLVGVQALDELSENLKKFGSMSWGEIGRGLTSMGLALTELGVVFGALGMVASFSGIIGAATILIGVQALDEISENLKIFGSMSWSEIGRGLTAMGIALVELGVVFGALGMLTGVSGILGAATILVGVQGLDEIANALQKFGSMSWSEIGRGLTAMGLALTELGVVFGLLGVLAGPAGILGAGTILIGVQGLDDLANALLKFGSMSWDEVKSGLAAMGGALGELAVGGLLNTLSIIGAHSISEMAEPLGTLADSIKKWSGVTIPANLGLQLAILANGVYAFTFGGLGASAISTVAEPLGILADSVKKWTNVTIPAGLVENFATLADGIKEFTFSGIGASALSTAAAPLGTLADSVKKWATVTVPANIGAQLSSLADGVKSFSWAFMGGWSLNAVAGPLGELADDISKWSSISIPANLSTQISGLSDAVKSFSWAFMGGWSLSAVAGPLGELADDVKKWNDVKIPQNLPKQLTSLSDGVKSFTWAFAGGWSIDSVSGPLGKLANSVKKWNGVVIPEGIGKKLSSIATGVKSFSGVGDISSATKSFGSIAGSASKLGNIKFDYIAKGLVSLAKSLTIFSSSASSLSGIGNSIINNIVTPLQKASSQLSGTGGNLINSLSKGMSSKSSNVSSTITNIISKMISTFNGKKGQFQTAGVALMTQLANGMKKTSSKITSAIGSAMKSAVSAARSYYSSFESAGRSAASGFAAGITANSYMAIARARAMANAAANAAKQALDINSPSKVFRAIGYSVPEGFAMGIDRMGKVVTKASYGMTDRAVDTVSRSISRITDLVNNNIDAQPTIRPVLDLSNVRSGANSINGLLSGRTTLTVGTRSVNSIANTMSNHQNGSNSNDVVSAIKGLRKDISNMPRNSYTFGDITYDDGSNVADAVKTLVRAARVERRV